MCSTGNATNVTLILNGNIRNSTSGGTNSNCALSMGTYNWSSVASNPGTQDYYYDSSGILAGQNSIILDAGTNRSTGWTKLTAGTLCYIRSKSYVLYGVNVNMSTYAGLVMVTHSDSTGLIVFEPPVDEDIAYVQMAQAYNSSVHPDPGTNLYACYRCAVVGPGALISDNWFPMARGGRLECTIDIGELRGYGGFWGNLMCYSSHRVRNVNSTYNVQDVGMASNNSTFECGTAYCDSTRLSGGNPNPGALLTIGNEHGRNLKFRYGTIIAPNYTNGTGLIVGTGAHGCQFECENYIAPLATGAALEIQNEPETVSGDQIQHTTRDNTVSLGEVPLGRGTRYVKISNGGGKSLRNKILRGHFSGAVSSDAMLIEGADHYIGPEVRCDGTALPTYRLQSLAINAAGSGYAINDVVTLSGGTSYFSATILVKTLAGTGIATFQIQAVGAYTVTSTTFTQGSPPPASGGSGATFQTAVFVQEAAALSVNTYGLSTAPLSLVINAAGSGYAIGDIVTLAGGTALSPATVIVDTLSGSGIATFHVSAPGSYTITSTTFTQAPTPPPASGGTGATFQSAVFVPASSGLTVNEAYFAGDVALGTGAFTANNVRNIRSTSQAAMRSAYVAGYNLTAITSTTTGSVIPGATCAIAANTLMPGDTVDFVIRGIVTNGGGNNKTIQIEVVDNVGTVNLGALTFTGTAAGTFKYVGSLVVETNNVYAAYVDAYINGASTPTRTRRTGLTIGANTLTLHPEAWVLNASDSITVDYFEVAPRRKTADVP